MYRRFGVKVWLLPQPLTFKMEAAASSENFVLFYITTWHYIPEDHNLNT